VRVTKPGGQVLATLPMHGTWEEVEDLFEELLRDEDMRREIVTLQKLRRRRPTPSQLVAGLRELGIGENDVVVEHERFELLFRSGREFLFAPVIEHGPLRLWKAIIGRAEKPQALFWRFKEAIDTYYAGHVLAVTTVAGLLRVRVPGGGAQGNFAGEYWTRYPSLARLWKAPGAAAKQTDEFDLDLEMDFDVEEPASTPAAASQPFPDSAYPAAGDSGAGGSSSGFDDHELSGASELPAVEDASLGEDPFAGLLEELDASQAAADALAAEDAAAEAKRPPPKATGKAATLGALEDSSSGLRLMPRKAGESGASPLPARLPRKPGESGVSPLPARLPRKPGESGASPLPGAPPRKPGESGASPLPGAPPRKPGESGSAAVAKPGRVVLPGMPRVAPPPRTGSVPTVSTIAKPSAPVAKIPTASNSVTPPEPSATKPGEDDPFASMLTDDEDEIDEIDEIDELASLVDGELADEDDLASSFGNVSPDASPDASSSGMRRLPPPPPPGLPKKK
jgi:hypothetical protein